MDERLRRKLEERGLPPDANEQAAQEFYAGLSLEEKGELGVELGQPEERVAHDPDADILRVRHDADADYHARSAPLRPSTINEEARAVDVVLATEDPVVSTDLRTGEGILEVLRMDGVVVPDQIPLLNEHYRRDVRQQFGSFRNLRVEGRELVATMHVSSAEESIWTKIKEGHIRDVSVGHRPISSERVPPGQTRTIAGNPYTAPGSRALYVDTRWEPGEGSLTWKGADRRAKIRSQENITMDPKLFEYLRSIGLRKDASEAELQIFVASLTGDQATEAARLEAESTAGNRNEPPPADPPPPPPADNARTDLPEPPVDAAAVARQAVADERARVASLTDLAGDDTPAEVLQRTINEGTSVADAAPLFLAAVRAGRLPGQGSVIPPGAPGNRVGVPNGNARALAAGMLESFGVSDPTTHVMHNGRRNPGRADLLTEQDAEQGERFRNLSAMDLVRACLYADTGRRIDDREEALEMSRASMSGSTLDRVFTTNIYAQLMAGWAETPDTTGPWCDEEDVPNFLTQEDISLEAQARLQVLPRGDTAKHATMSDTYETYKIKRFAKQFVVDEQDVIDDRLGAIMRMPVDMGQAARSLRPDMVYSLILENPTMVDTGAVYNSTAVTTDGGHANLGTAVLGSAGLKAAITAMSVQRLSRTSTDPGRALNIRPKFLVIPPDLDWTARELTAPAALAKLFADSADPLYTTTNLLAQEGLTVVPDARLDAVGVMDPTSEAARTGSATNWFLFAGGNRGLRVAYRRGTGRLPQLRSFQLDRGQWGMGWDIKHDLGVAFTEWRTVYKSTGAG
jgi:hypothetical protein